ncbi:MAG: hypothetical protein ACRCUS_08495 [Anaerovoracaceae bacterium]
MIKKGLFSITLGLAASASMLLQPWIMSLFLSIIFGIAGIIVGVEARKETKAISKSGYVFATAGFFYQFWE